MVEPITDEQLAQMRRTVESDLPFSGRKRLIARLDAAEVERDENEKIMKALRRQRYNAEAERDRQVAGREVEQTFIRNTLPYLARLTALAEAAMEVGDSNFRRLENSLRRSDWPEVADRVQHFRRVLEDVIQADATEPIRDDGCTCKRTTWDESCHELHQKGCPNTLPSPKDKE